MKRIAFLFSDWDANAYRQENDLYGGIGYYRVIKPAQQLRKWFEVDVIGADFRHWGTTAEKYDRLGKYDLIISKHLRTPEEASNTLATAKHFKKKILVDIDDNYLDIRKDNPAFADYEYGKGAREYMSAFISLADGLIVSTDPLKKVYKTLNKNIDVIPNCNDVNDWPNVRKQWGHGTIRIGFAGGMGHDADLELILEPMAYILAKYPNVTFEILGALSSPEQAMRLGIRMNEFCKKNITKQFRFAGGTLAWQGYPELLASNGWDIVLAPLVDEPFNRGKSHIRWLETSMIYAPLVASQVYPYFKDIQGKKTIVDGITGFFASTPEHWFRQIEKLINDKELRNSVATNSYNYVKENWQYEQWAEKYKKVIDKYI